MRRLGKGAGVPVRSEADRAIVLAALAMVDAVVVFDEDTPLELVRGLEPDVIVKGGDYTPASVVGARRSHGSRRPRGDHPGHAGPLDNFDDRETSWLIQ